MASALSKNEQVHRRLVVADMRAAAGLPTSVDVCRAARVTTVKNWTTLIRAEMDAHPVSDPLQILPELLTRLQEIAAKLQGKAPLRARAGLEFRGFPTYRACQLGAALL